MDIQLLTFGWEQFDVRDLVRLCKTNKQFSQLCKDSKTWSILLARDYNIDYNGPDALDKYVGQFLRAIAAALNRYADTLFENGNYILDAGNIRLGKERLKRAHESKTLALSALGIDSTNKYSTLFGNKIGEDFAKVTKANMGATRFFSPDINIFDALFNILDTVESQYQTMMDNR